MVDQSVSKSAGEVWTLSNVHELCRQCDTGTGIYAQRRERKCSAAGVGQHGTRQGTPHAAWCGPHPAPNPPPAHRPFPPLLVCPSYNDDKLSRIDDKAVTHLTGCGSRAARCCRGMAKGAEERVCHNALYQDRNAVIVRYLH